ncbi:MAG: hypothetical protein M3Z50_10690 [Actinomycetota bacterium]|nr:hypothetical protein [Actinomycetota bacterium]
MPADTMPEPVARLRRAPTGDSRPEAIEAPAAPDRPQLCEDPFTPVLAGRLASMSRAGVQAHRLLPHVTGDTANAPLRDEHAAAAL